MTNESKPGFFQRLKDRLTRPGGGIGAGLVRLFGARKIDATVLEELETQLLAADVGHEVTEELLEGLRSRVARQQLGDVDALVAALRSDITVLLTPVAKPLIVDRNAKPYTILVVGVNGSGKTTTIGKLCALLQRNGARVVVGAADTFRAAAIEQLKVWADRSGATFVARGQGADAAGVAYEAVEAARAQNADVCLIDTAGRLQNREELMSELAKILRAIRKVDEDAPHETLLVLDATVGQNALSQMEAFRSAAGVTGIVMNKLDGTAKGGVLVAIAEKHAIPIHFIGVGESADDLQPFQARAFARALAGLDDAA